MGKHQRTDPWMSCLLAVAPIGDDRWLDSRPEHFHRHGGCSGGRNSLASWRWSLIRRGVGTRGSFSSPTGTGKKELYLFIIETIREIRRRNSTTIKKHYHRKIFR